MSFPYPKPFPGASLFGMAAVAAAVGGAALIDGETQGLGIDFTYDTDRSAQMEVLDTGTPANSGTFDPYNKLTYTSPSLKMCRQSDGVWRYGNHNFAYYSQDFTNNWGQNGASPSSNATTAPDGTLTADKIVENSANSQHELFDVSFDVSKPDGAPAKWAVYAKAAERTWLSLNCIDGSNNVCFFHLSGAGATGTTAAGCTSSIEALANGWYKCTVNKAAAGSSMGMAVGPASADNTATYQGDGASGLYAWGAQAKRTPVEEPSGLDSYLATEGAHKYGLPYEWDANGDPLGILIEEQRTNLCLRSQDFTGAAWTASEVTVTANDTTAPDGTSTADKSLESTNSNIHQLHQLFFVLGTTFTASVYAKDIGRRFFRLIINDNATGLGTDHWVAATFDLTLGTVARTGVGSGGGTLVGASISAEANGWYRCTVSGTLTTFTAGILLINHDNAGAAIAGSDDRGRPATFAGDATKGFYFWGAQLEARAFPTSPIHTIGATVTRAIDNITLAGSLFPLSQTAGTMVFEGVPTFLGTDYGPAYLDVSGGVGGDEMFLASDPFLSNAVSFQVMDDHAGTGASAGSNAGITAGVAYKHAAAWAVNNFGAAKDGTLASSTPDTSGALPGDTMTTLHLGSGPSGTRHAPCYIRKATYLPRRATDTELQTRTAA